MKKVFGLIGYPLSHSFSQQYFSKKFKKENLVNQEYHLFELNSIEQVIPLIKTNSNLKGLNVTIPYKKSIIPFLDELDETASEIGAVNCVKIIDSLTKGYNTDAYGFQQSIKPFLENHHTKALILGTGGAAMAVAYVLKNLGIDYFFVSRNHKEKSSETLSKNIFSYQNLTSYVVSSFPLVINTSPVGMFPNIQELPDFPYEYITDKHFLYDLIYNPEETEFLKKGKLKGAQTQNGLSMLYFQAEKAWEIWNE